MTLDVDEIESAVADSLRARADDCVDTGALLAEATSRGRTIRRRRRVWTIATSVAATVAVVVAVAAVPLWRSSGDRPVAGPPPAGPPPVASSSPFEPPVAAGVAGAASRPDLVGTDPGAIHFGLRIDAGIEPTFVNWYAEEGYESVHVQTDAGDLTFDLARDRALLDAIGLEAKGARLDHRRDRGPSPPGPSNGNGEPGPEQAVTVAGRAGTIREVRLGDKEKQTRFWLLRWQPRDGLWSQVVAGDRTNALVLASAVRLDQARRCVVPFRLASAPSGTRLTGCTISLSAGWSGERARPSARLTFRMGALGYLGVHADPPVPADTPAEKFPTNRTVAGHPAAWQSSGDAGASLSVRDFDGIALTVSVRGTGDHEGLVTWVVEHLSVAANPADPATWPSPSVG